MSDDLTEQAPQHEAPGLVETVNRANLANILKKLKAGKTLNGAELDIVAGVPPAATVARAREAEREEAEGHSRERAAFWGCALRTMQIMIKDGVPVDDPEAMVVWFSKLPGRSQGMLKNSFRMRIYEERAKLDASHTAAPQLDPDVEEFDRTYKPSAGDERDNLADIKRQRSYYLFRMQRARARKDYSAEADAAKQFRNFSDVVHDCELRAQRLGRDLGESFSASDVDRLGRAWAYWSMNVCDTLVTEIAAAVTPLVEAKTVDRENVRQAIEGALLAERFLVPLVRASQVNAGVALPARFVAAVKAGCAACLEDGEAEFAKLYSTPVPEPAKVPELVAVSA